MFALNRFHLLFFLYCAVLALFTWFSYSLTAPNLVLTAWSPYWRFQTWMWETFFNNRVLLTQVYGVVVTVLVAIYLGLLKSISSEDFTSKSTRYLLLILGLPISILFLSSTALSYDVFNYIFNAKMVAVYDTNPHQHVALEFAQDPWIRFMHNTHTAAPYGYGWTGLSLVPYLLGLGKFFPTWLLFKAFSLLSLWITFFSLRWLLNRKHTFGLAVLFLNPLLLIEVISSAHNDLWMLWPAILAVGIIARKKSLPLGTLVLAALLLAFSISIKLATIVLIPLWLALVLSKIGPKLPFTDELQKYWPVAASMLLFIPLFTTRSQQFHPWYLLWPLVWLPLIVAIPAATAKDGLSQLLKNVSIGWIFIVIALSVTSLYRYVPYLLAGYHSDTTLMEQKLITWSGVGLGVVAFLLFKLFSRSKK